MNQIMIQVYTIVETQTLILKKWKTKQEKQD